jgi:chemotaxis protein methyltransferase CheR
VIRAPTSRQIERYRGIIADRLGLDVEENKLGMLSDVLSRGLARCGAAGSDDYLARLDGGMRSQELDAISGELTVAETYFFRDQGQFRVLADVALPIRMRSRERERSLTILSAGCATGEEAYSIAMLLRDTPLDPAFTVAIRAVDVNPAVLARAERGSFSSWALRETPREVQDRWFRKQGKDFVLHAAIRNAVRFEQRNLVCDDGELWQHGAYDLVFCRNVLMYFTTEQARAVVARIARSLAPGGFLFLGHAETLRGLSHEFHLRHSHDTFYYERAEEPVRPTIPRPSPIVPRVSNEPLPVLAPDNATWVEAISAAAQRVHALSRPRTTASSPRLMRYDLGSALEHLEGDRFGEALDRLESLPSDSSDDPDVLLLKAALLAHSGDFAGAGRVSARLLARDELNAGAHYVLALSREGLGDRAGAIDHDQTSAYLDCTFAMPRLHLGLLARRAGDLDGARRELGQALVLLEREDSARILLFGGGFRREALIALCKTQLLACGSAS